MTEVELLDQIVGKVNADIDSLANTTSDSEANRRATVVDKRTALLAAYVEAVTMLRLNPEAEPEPEQQEPGPQGAFAQAERTAPRTFDHEEGWYGNQDVPVVNAEARPRFGFQPEKRAA